MQVLENVSLKQFNTFGIQAHAAFFAQVGSIEQLQALLSLQKEKKHLPLLILGGGSNLLFTKDFPGLVLKNEIKGIVLLKEDAEFVYVRVGAGENWHSFVMYCIDKGWGGVENLSLIPGTAGAAPIQNIGAYGVEIQEVIETVEALHIHENVIVPFGVKDCEFGYRDSVFKHRHKGMFVIVAVVFKLRKQPIFNISYGALREQLAKMGVQTLSLRAVSDAVIAIRTSKLPDPSQIGNAGSFFKNPTISKAVYENLRLQYPDMPGFASNDGQVKVPAGWLIEQCGWKGYRKGDAGCYPLQALVLVNYGSASGKEIRELANNITLSVEKKFGIKLVPEVNII